MENKESILTFFKNRTYIEKIINRYDFITILFANIFLGELFFHLINISLYLILCTGIAAILLDYILIKPEILFSFSKGNNERKEKNNLKKKNSIKETYPNIIKSPNLKIILKIIIVFIRFLFFNILKEIFILSIIWSGILFFLFVFGVISLKTSPQIILSVLTVLGVLSGFFNIYIKNYKETLFLRLNRILKNYFDRIIEINFLDFIYYLEEKKSEEKNKECIDSLKKIILRKNSVSMRELGFRHSIIHISIPYKIEDLRVFREVDFLIKEKEMTKDFKCNKNQIKKYYENYFNDKLNSFKKKINNMNLERIRSVFLFSIFFSEDIYLDLEDVNLNMIEKYEERLDEKTGKDDAKIFEKYYVKFNKEAVEYFFEKMLLDK